MSWSTMIGASGVRSEAVAAEAKRRASSTLATSGASSLFGAARGAIGGSMAGAATVAEEAAADAGGLIPDILDTADTWTRWTSAAVIALALALALGAVGFIVWNVRKVIA